MLDKFMEIVEEVPFGNSDFQNRFAVVDCEDSPHRAYRHAALRISDRLRALMECYYNLREKNIELAKLKRQLEKEEDDLEKELIMLKIEKTESEMPYLRKLIKDAVQEINSLLPIIRAVGKMTRSQFESMEKEHFERKYARLVAGENDILYGFKIVSGEKDLYEEITSIGWNDYVKFLEGKKYGELDKETADLLKSVEDSVNKIGQEVGNVVKALGEG